MAKKMIGLMEYIGIADTLPLNPQYFTEITLSEVLVIPKQKPDIEQMLSVMVSADVVSTRLIETDKAVSDEGQNLSGCKIVIEIKLHEKVKYVANEPTQSVHVAEFDTNYKSVFVVVPCQVNGIAVCEYIRKNKMSVTPYIEDVFAKATDLRTVFKNVTLFVDVVFRN